MIWSNSKFSYEWRTLPLSTVIKIHNHLYSPGIYHEINMLHTLQPLFVDTIIEVLKFNNGIWNDQEGIR